eukprot:jgi/Chrzof1/9089/Cz03g35200.t1
MHPAQQPRGHVTSLQADSTPYKSPSTTYIWLARLASQPQRFCTCGNLGSTPGNLRHGKCYPMGVLPVTASPRVPVTPSRMPVRGG